MARYDDLVALVAIHVSPCPEPAIISALQQTTRDFCKETRVWVHDVPETAVIPAQLSYTLELPEQTTIVHVWGIDGRTGNYELKPEHYITFPNTLNFNKLPARDTFKPVVSLMPSAESEEIPDLLVEYFQDYIVSGAVAHLQMQPFRDWSQPNAAEAHLFKYQQGLQEAILMRDNGLNMSKIKGRVRPQYI